MKPGMMILFMLNLYAPVWADYDEDRLLQGWGMRWDSEGKLELIEPVKTPQHRAWMPEVSDLPTGLGQPSREIQPIIIRP